MPKLIITCEPIDAIQWGGPNQGCQLEQGDLVNLRPTATQHWHPCKIVSIAPDDGLREKLEVFLTNARKRSEDELVYVGWVADALQAILEGK